MNIRLAQYLYLTRIPESIRESLIQNLTVVNPKWIDNKRMGRWNRGTPSVLRYYRNLPGGGLRVPRGYLRRLIMMCRKQGVDCVLEDQRRQLPPVDYAFGGSLRDYQQTAADSMLKRDFGTLTAPTGSGKTVIGLYMIARRRQPALVVTHTRDLANQWVDRIGSFLKMAEKDIGFIGGGKKRIGERITVALVQSLYKCAKAVSPQVGFLVVDECHRCPSRTFTEAVTRFDCRFMLGLSATPWRRDRLSRLIFWHLGDVHHEVPRQRLVKTGQVLNAEVIFRMTDFNTSHDPVTEYSKMLSELTADDGRNRMIAADVAGAAETASGTCLVLSDRRKHCDNLRVLIRHGHGIDCAVLTGEVPAAERQEVIGRLNSGAIRVLIATGQLIGEGFDCRNLSTLFLATPIRFSGRLIQYLGRVLRPAPGKSKAVVYDYVDEKVDVLAAAARARQRVYGQDALEVIDIR